jgi:hypothetical protein
MDLGIGGTERSRKAGSKLIIGGKAINFVNEACELCAAEV